MTATLVHLTRIRPGRRAEVDARLDAYRPDPDELRTLGIRRLEFFTSTELSEDGVVVAVIEGDDEAAVARFLDANERDNNAEIDRLYLPHNHDAVAGAPARFTWDARLSA